MIISPGGRGGEVFKNRDKKWIVRKRGFMRGHCSTAIVLIYDHLSDFFFFFPFLFFLLLRGFIGFDEGMLKDFDG